MLFFKIKKVSMTVTQEIGMELNLMCLLKNI